MALTPPNDQALLREVDDAVRADLLMSTWTRYGRWIIAAIVAGLALFGAWLWWSDNRAERSGATAETLARAADVAQGGGTPDAKAIDTIAAEGHAGYRANALLLKAATASRANRRAEAIALYRQIAADDDIAEPYRQLATIRQTALEFDTLSPDAVITRLRPLAEKGGPWFGSAGEMTGIAYMKKREYKLAGPIFAALAVDMTVPQTIRSRAVQMAGLLGVDAVRASTGLAAATR